MGFARGGTYGNIGAIASGTDSSKHFWSYIFLEKLLSILM